MPTACLSVPLSSSQTTSRKKVGKAKKNRIGDSTPGKLSIFSYLKVMIMIIIIIQKLGALYKNVN
jgi:hypothetical protein